MQIVRLVWSDPARPETYLRDPHEQGAFVVGVECNEVGVGVRKDGCTEEPAVMIRRDRIASLEPV